MVVMHGGRIMQRTIGFPVTSDGGGGVTQAAGRVIHAPIGIDRT